MKGKAPMKIAPTSEFLIVFGQPVIEAKAFGKDCLIQQQGRFIVLCMTHKTSYVLSYKEFCEFIDSKDVQLCKTLLSR